MIIKGTPQYTIVTLEELRTFAYLEVDNTVTSAEDVLYTSYIETAIEDIEDRLGRVLPLRSVTFDFSVEAGDSVELVGDVSSITTVTKDGDDVPYTISQSTLTLDGVSTGLHRVVYEAGYPEANFPNVLKNAILMLASSYIDNRQLDLIRTIEPLIRRYRRFYGI